MLTRLPGYAAGDVEVKVELQPQFLFSGHTPLPAAYMIDQTSPSSFPGSTWGSSYYTAHPPEDTKIWPQGPYGPSAGAYPTPGSPGCLSPSLYGYPSVIPNRQDLDRPLVVPGSRSFPYQSPVLELPSARDSRSRRRGGAPRLSALRAAPYPSQPDRSHQVAAFMTEQKPVTSDPYGDGGILASYSYPSQRQHRRLGSAHRPQAPSPLISVPVSSSRLSTPSVPARRSARPQTSPRPQNPPQPVPTPQSAPTPQPTPTPEPAPTPQPQFSPELARMAAPPPVVPDRFQVLLDTGIPPPILHTPTGENVERQVRREGATYEVYHETPKFDGDLYTPTYMCRRLPAAGAKAKGNWGFCGRCPNGGRWLRMKQSQYLYDLQNSHGIHSTGRLLPRPAEVRQVQDSLTRWEARCELCDKWLLLKDPKKGINWFRHVVSVSPVTPLLFYIPPPPYLGLATPLFAARWRARHASRAGEKAQARNIEEAELGC